MNMKKSIALVALAFGVTSAFAQDLTSKKGEPILPEAGDWAIGIEAAPFLNYAGNFFGKTVANTAPTWNFLNGNSIIVGKYFKDASTAYRAGLRIGLTSNTQRTMVADRTTPSNTVVTYPTASAMKENEWKNSMTAIGLSGGIEKRKGKTRLQGFYGGELSLWWMSTKDKFTYGNALSAPAAGNTNPVSVSAADDAFAGATNIAAAPPIQGVIGAARAKERKNGSTLSFGIRGFIGAEYFILPKISIGAEFGWGIALSNKGKTSTTWESIGASNSAGSTAQVGSTTIEGSKTGSFSLDTDQRNNPFSGATGALRLNLHF
jgi:hypothetical protein